MPNGPVPSPPPLNAPVNFEHYQKEVYIICHEKLQKWKSRKTNIISWKWKKIHCHTCFPLVLHPITNTRRQFWYAVNSFSPVTSQSCCLHKTFTVSAKLCRKILYSSNERLLQLPYLAHLNTVQHRRIWRLRCIYSTIIWHNMAMHSVCRKGWSEHGQLNGKVATS